MAELVLGRENELQRLARFVGSLRDGLVACVLEGEAGIGKTELWREGVACAEAASFRILSSSPAEAETALAYSSLADLLTGVGPELLAELQRRNGRHSRLHSCARTVPTRSPVSAP